MKSLFLVGIGGFIGSILRYSASMLIGKIGEFPLSTFVVNIVGCFMIGLLYGLAAKYEWFSSADMRLLLVVGLCGGFTTFSTFSFESLTLLQQSQYLTFFLYIFGSVAMGILATIFGVFLTK